MKLIITILLSVTNVLVYSDTKDVLKRIPSDYDYVMCLRFPELFKNKKLSEKMLDNKSYKDFKEKMTAKIGLEEKDFLAVYIGGVAAQYQRMKSWKELDKQQYDTAVFAELARPVELANLKSEFPEVFAGEKVVNGVTCIQFKDKQMKNAYLAFLSPELLLLTSDHQLPRLTKLAVEQSVLAESQAKRLLTTNGFGGVLSFVHWGQIDEVHPMTPWMKNYTGGTMNVYFEENQDISMECTMSFNDLQSVKSASLLINMGMSFLDFKPELAMFKQMIDFKAYQKNLLVDVKVTPTSWSAITQAFEGMQFKGRGKK